MKLGIDYVAMCITITLTLQQYLHLISYRANTNTSNNLQLFNSFRHPCTVEVEQKDNSVHSSNQWKVQLQLQGIKLLLVLLAKVKTTQHGGDGRVA